MADERIEQHVQIILRGSGLPVDRRAEVACELREHLEQLAARRRGDGSAEDAVEEAMAEFGDVRRIRALLRGEQRRADRRAALAAAWRIRWLLVGVSACVAMVISLAAGAGGAGIGLLMFATFLPGVIAMAFAAELLAIDVRRARPVDEFRFGARLARWFVRVAAGMAAVLAWCALLSGGALWLLRAGPQVEFFPWYFLYLEGGVLTWALVGTAVKATLFAVAVAMCITLYERARCGGTRAA